MSDSNSIQSFATSEVENDVGFIRTIFRLHDMMRECAIPAIVKEYTRATHKAKVQPIVKWVRSLEKEDKDGLERPVYEVSVLQLRHGGYMLDWPINEGDTGWLVASDRNAKTAREKNSSTDSSENEGPQLPDSYELHSFKNGLFVPDSWIDDTGTKYANDKTFVIRGLNSDCSIDLIIDDPSNSKDYLKKFSVRKDGLYLDDQPFTGGGGGMNLICGDYSNVVFTNVTSGANAGKTKIDVFYK